MANSTNLKPFKQGQSGNPSGRPKGSVNLATHIRRLLNEESKGPAPIEAIIKVAILKALDGDIKSMEWLARYGYGTKLDVTSDDKPLPVPIYGGLSIRPQDVTLPLDSRRLKE